MLHHAAVDRIKSRMAYFFVEQYVFMTDGVIAECIQIPDHDLFQTCQTLVM